MSCGGGSGSNTVTQANQPPANVQQAYSNLTGAAFTQAQQPLQQYNNPLIAGFTPQQTQAFQTIQNSQGMATPYINAAAQEFGQATTPFYQSEPAYQSPYTGQVTNALQGLFNENNAEQQAQTNSNSTAQGAFGGDRSAVANALTAKQQNLSEAPTLANVLQGGYQTALGAAEAQGWLGEQGGFGLGSLGTEAQNSALTGANAELSAGGLQQQLGQEMLNIPYEQFQSAQAYPWQVLGELSPIVSGIGSLSGGTGSTTYPGPSLASQLGGLGVAGLGTYGLLNQTGALDSLGIGSGASGNALASAVGAGAQGTVDESALFGALGAKTGGRIGFADGGGIGGTSSLPTVPSVNLDYLVHPGPLSKGSGPPHAPQGNPEQFQGQSPAQEMQMFNGIDKMVGEAGIGAGSAFGGRLYRQDGGGSGDSSQSGLGAAETTGAPLAGLPPNAQGFVQKMQTLPMDQLQAIAARTPPSSPYGQMIQRVLMSRRMTPTAAPNQVSSASGVPIGTGIGQVPGIGGQSQGQGQQQQQQQPGAQQGQGYAVGGGPVIQEEPDMDPHPVVDHSGDTVVVRYPSEGKEIDLGIPSSKSQRRTLAAGGAGGAVTPGPPTVLGSGASNAQPFFSSETAPNGIAIPQLSMDAFAAPGGPNSMTANQGGIGNWFNPIPNLGTTGATAPTTIPLSPAFLQALGTPIPPAPAAPTSSGSSSGSSAASSITSMLPALAMAAMMFAKKGGRTGLQDGGEGDAVPGVEIAPDSPFASGNGFGSPDLGPAAAVVTPAGGVVTAPGPTPAPEQAAPSPAPDSGNKYDAYLRAHGETPQEGVTPAAATTMPPGQSDPLAPVMEHIAQPESGGRNVLYGGAPVPPGNVIPGEIGPTGQQTHAFSKYQFEPATWNGAAEAARAQGRVLDKDNPQDVEWAGRFTARNTYGTDQNGHNLDQAAAAGTVDYSRLAHVWPSLAPHQAGGPPDPIIGRRGGIGTSDNMPNSYSVGYRSVPDGAGIGEPYGGIGGAGVTLPPPRTAPSAQWSQSPWMIPIAIGAGMMSGRSSHPLVNLGQGLTEGIKTAETQGEQGTRAAAYENEAANRQATLQQTGKYQRDEIDIRQQELTRQLQQNQNQFDIAMKKADTQDKREAAQEEYWKNLNAIGAAKTDLAAAKPISWWNPKTGEVGTNAFDPTSRSYNIPEGAMIGKPPAGPQSVYNQIIADGGAKNMEEAIHVVAAAKANPDAFRKNAQFAALVGAEKGRLGLTELGKPDADLNAEAQHNVIERLRTAPEAIDSAAGEQRPTASAAPPTGGQAAAPAGPAWTQEHPLVPRTQADIDNAPPGSVIQTPSGLRVKPPLQPSP